MKVAFFDFSQWGTAVSIVEDYKFVDFFAFTKYKNKAHKNIIYLDSKLTKQQVVAKQFDFIKSNIITKDIKYYGMEKEVAVHGVDNWKDIYALARYQIHVNHSELLVVPPTSLKLFATGKGNAQKEDLMIQAYKDHKLDFSEYIEIADNIVDSFFGALLTNYYFNIVNNSDKIRLITYQKKALDSLLKSKKK